MSISMSNVTAKDIMTPEVFMAYEGWSVKRLSSFFIKNNISGAPVIASDHSLVGVVTATDVINFEGKSNREQSELVEEVYSEYLGVVYDAQTSDSLVKKADECCTVNKVMTKEVISIDEDSHISEVADKMLSDNIRRIFVTRNGIMCGVISTKDILAALRDSK